MGLHKTRNAGIELMGTVDRHWWMTMLNNEHTISACAGNMVRILASQDTLVGRISRCDTQASGPVESNGMYGVVTYVDGEHAYVKLAGVVEVECGEDIIVGDKLTCVDGVAMRGDAGPFCATVLRVVSPRVALATIDRFRLTKALPPAAVLGVGPQDEALRVAFGVIDVKTLQVDTNFPAAGIVSARLTSSPETSSSADAARSALEVVFAPGYFSSVSNTVAGLVGTGSPHTASSVRMSASSAFVILQGKDSTYPFSQLSTGSVNVITYGGKAL